MLNDVNKIKIMHLAYKHAPDDNRILHKQCVSLAKNSSYDVHYVTSSLNIGGTNVNFTGVKQHVIDIKKNNIFSLLLYFVTVIKIIKCNHFDVIEIHEPILLLLAIWLKKIGCIVIFDSHEDYEKQIPASRGNNLNSRLLASLYKRFEGYVTKRIDAVLFPCKMIDRTVFKPQNVKRLVYIDNYPILRKCLINKNIQSIVPCYTGTISEERGALICAKAWYDLGLKGVMAGNFSSKDYKDYFFEVKESKSVDYRGYCNQEDLDDVYLECNIGISVLLDVGQYHRTCNFPTKVYEYMMHGIPAIVHKTKYTDSVMKEYSFGKTVDTNDCEGIKRELLFFINHPNSIIEMGRNAREAVEKEFNWESQEKKLLDLYREIIEEEKNEKKRNQS